MDLLLSVSLPLSTLPKMVIPFDKNIISNFFKTILSIILIGVCIYFHAKVENICYVN